MQPMDPCKEFALSCPPFPHRCSKKWDRCRLFVNEVVSGVLPAFWNDASSDVATFLKLAASKVPRCTVNAYEQKQCIFMNA